MIKFDIELQMKTNGFEADSVAEAKELIEEELRKLGYGISIANVNWDIWVTPSAYQGD